MSALNMGFAQLQVVPVMTGFNKTIKQELGSAFPTLGKQAGVDFGKAVGQGFSSEKKSIESEVKALEKNLASTQDKLKGAKEANARASEKETDALKKLEIAELQLNETRESGKAKASNLARAEENVRQKQLALKKAQEDSHRSAVTLENVTEDLATANDKLKVAADKANKELSESTGSTDKAKKGLKSVKDQAADTQRGLGSLGKFMAGAFAGAIAGVSFGAVIGGMKEAIQLAGDYQQSVGAIDSIFKDQAGKMHAKSDAAAVDVGLDKNSFNELGSVLGAQMKNAGTPMDQLADKTSNLITLGADLSSMFGGTTKEAVEAISSALKGEMDPIEKYGISLSQASLEAEALSKGIIKPTKDAVAIEEAATKMTLAQTKYNEAIKKHGKDSDEAKRAQLGLASAERAFNKASAGKLPKLEAEAKALAIQSALYSQSADAQGNFGKEADTLQGQQQRLNAEIANMKISAGTAFIPAMTKIVQVIRTTVIPALQNMGQWIKDNQAWLKPLALTVASAAGAFLMFKGVTGTIFGLTKTVEAFKGGFSALNIVMKANVFVLIASAIAGLVAGFIYLWNTNEGFRNFFIGMWEGIKTAFNATVQWFGGILNTLGGFFSTVWGGIQTAVGAVVGFFQNTVAPMFVWFYQNVILPVWNGIKLAIAIVVTAVMLYINMWVAIWNNVLAPAITSVWENVLKPTFQAIGTVFKWVWDTLLKPAFDAVVRVFKFIGTSITWTWNNVLKPVFNTLGTFFKWVWDTILKPAFNALKLGFQTVVNNIKYFWNTYLKPVFQAVGTFMRDTVAPMFQRAVDKIKSVWSSIKTAFKGVWDWVSEKVFNPVKKLITETIPNAFQTGVDFIKDAWNKVANIARKPINFVIETVYGGLRDTFNKVADSLGLPKDWRLPKVDPVKEFYTGGYTGPGNKYDYAGDVHAGEYVLRKEATSKLRRAFGLKGLDHMNKFGTIPGYSSGGLVRPLKGGAITSRFGASRGQYPHAGTDFAVPVGTPIFAAMDGTVQKAGTKAIAGRTGIGAFLGHDGGRNTYYGHLSKLLVQVGDVVKAGQQIALSGNTGRSTGPHLHFETWVGGKPVNAEPYLNGAAMPTGGVGGGWNPLQGLFDLKDKMVSNFSSQFDSNNMLAQVASGALNKLVSGPIKWIEEKAAAIGDVGQDIWGNAKDWFNGKDSDVQAAVRNVAAGYGWNSGRQWDSLSKLINKESSWNPNAQNKTSTAYGLFQFLNGTWAGLGTKTSDPTGQATAGLKYISQRYGDPEKAWAFHKRNNWYAKGGYAEKPTLYDNGGWLKPGAYQTISNLTRKPEAIYTADQNRALQTLASHAERNLTAPTGDQYYISVPKPAATAEDIVGAVNHQVRVNRRGGR